MQYLAQPIQNLSQLSGNASNWPQPRRLNRRSAGPRANGEWQKACLNVNNASIELTHEKKDDESGSWAAGYLFSIHGVVPDDKKEFPALASLCPSCGSDYSFKLRKKSPIRGFRTGFGKLSQVLTKELFKSLPEESRKLVVFSDSREDAAQISASVQNNNYSDVLKEMFNCRIKSTINHSSFIISWPREQSHFSAGCYPTICR